MWCSRGGWHRAGSPRCVSEPWLWVCAHRMQPGPAVMLWGEQQQQGWLQVMGRARGQATLPLYPPGSAAHPVPHAAPSQSQSKPRPPLAPHKFHTLGNPTGTAPPGTQHTEPCFHPATRLPRAGEAPVPPSGVPRAPAPPGTPCTAPASCRRQRGSQPSGAAASPPAPQPRPARTPPSCHTGWDALERPSPPSATYPVIL